MRRWALDSWVLGGEMGVRVPVFRGKRNCCEDMGRSLVPLGDWALKADIYQQGEQQASRCRGPNASEAGDGLR